jgi:2-isopropylmalate synthase
VLVETSDRHGSWMTVGVSSNIIEASWRALLDSVVVGLVRAGVQPETPVFGPAMAPPVI